MKKNINFKNIGVIVGAIVFSILIPLITNSYSLGVMNLVLLYFIAALGLNILIGMGGQISFATVSFVGFGSYSYAIFSKNAGLHPIISLILAVIVTALIALVLGKILFRLKGTYFTFATIGFVQITANIFLNWVPVTGGPNGITEVPNLKIGNLQPNSPIVWFYLLMVISVICLFLVENIRKTQLGRSLAAVRDNELAAQSLGVDVYNTKVIAFCIAGAFAGLSGAILAPHNQAISAYLYTYDMTINYLVMVMLGGVNSTIGTFVGSILVTMMPEWLRPLQQYMRLIYGVLIIILMIFMPMGLAGLAQKIWTRIKGKNVKTNKVEGECR